MSRVVVIGIVLLLLGAACDSVERHPAKPSVRLTSDWVLQQGYPGDVGENRNIYKKSYDRASKTLGKDNMFERLSELENEIIGTVKE